MPPKKAAKRVVPPRQPAPGRRYWLVKSEPDCFAFEDLMRAPRRTTGWDGVRNFQARNFMRDEMQVGDGVLYYHSSAAPPAIAGIAEVARAAYPDPTQFDPASEYFDPKASDDAPIWMQVDIRAVAPLPRPLALDELRRVDGLERMELLRKGSRLSVQPVRPEEWAAVLAVAGLRV